MLKQTNQQTHLLISWASNAKYHRDLPATCLSLTVHLQPWSRLMYKTGIPGLKLDPELRSWSRLWKPEQTVEQLLSTDGRCCYLLPCLSGHNTHFCIGRLLQKWCTWILRSNPVLQFPEKSPNHKTIGYFGVYAAACPAPELDCFQECVSCRARRLVCRREPALVDILCYTVIGYKEEIKLRADTVILGLPLLAECTDLSGLQSWILAFLPPWPRNFYTPGYLIAHLQHDGLDEFMNS